MSLNLLVKCLLAAVAMASQEPDRDISPEITQAPRPLDSAMVIEPRQYFGHDLIGYEPYSNSWYAITCGGSGDLEYVTFSTVGQCCKSGGSTCNYATACRGNLAVYQNGGTGDCGTNKCDAITVMASRNALEAEIQTIIRCLPTEEFHERGRTYYRNTFPLQTTATKTQKETVVVTHAATHTSSPGSALGRDSRQASGFAVIGFCVTVFTVTLSSVRLF